jgi:hypothetical protein
MENVRRQAQYRGYKDDLIVNSRVVVPICINRSWILINVLCTSLGSLDLCRLRVVPSCARLCRLRSGKEKIPGHTLSKN